MKHYRMKLEIWRKELEKIFFLMIKLNLRKKMFSKCCISLHQIFICFFDRQIIDLLSKVDLLHMKKSISGDDDPDERYFLHTYDDYFS